MNKELLGKLKEKLEMQKIALHKELESFANEDPNLKHNWDTRHINREEADKDEQADEVQEYDNKLSLEYSLELKLKNVNNALDKINNGTYGICENCGKEIGEDRLLVCPEAKTCLNCHKK